VGEVVARGIEGTTLWEEEKKKNLAVSGEAVQSDAADNHGGEPDHREKGKESDGSETAGHIRPGPAAYITKSDDVGSTAGHFWAAKRKRGCAVGKQDSTARESRVWKRQNGDGVDQGGGYNK